jgi:hypothetical protein
MLVIIAQSSVFLVDPDGMLYHDNSSDLTGQCEYKVAREVDEGVVYAHIIFFHDIYHPIAEVCCLSYSFLCIG